MALTIRFKRSDEEQVFDPSPAEREGVISFGDLRESFLSPTTYWSTEQYLQSWTDNIRNVRSGRDGFLATEIGQPDTAALFIVWPLLWVRGSVHITEMLVLRDRAKGEFQPSNLMQLIEFDDLRRSLPNISNWILSQEDLVHAQVNND